ncbi:MAG: acyl dehydratase [Devosia nanyangense]|uniref:Acyl dehydratase n=1 Tax=Devosia nanyangense TaxID=1228055 RepID=A0A933KZ86_9HYPH|nr:acyl dehydratase [Devosia nanyangense]
MSAVDAPHFDDLEIGDRFASAPRMTLTAGMAAVHHAIVGGRLRLAFDAELAAEVTGSSQPFASPALVWDIAIGQSTLVTQRAIANLFYRGLSFLSAPCIGDTLSTETTIVGLRPLTPKPDRPPRGLVVMRIRTVDQKDRAVLDFHRCAMLPARVESGKGPRGIVDLPASAFSIQQLSAAVRNWSLARCRGLGWAPSFESLAPGTALPVVGGDAVSSAPELARLTMNLAAIHHDLTISATGERLVYGGHTIGIALAQITRALPSLATIVAWHDCDHLGPVREGDTLHSQVGISACEPRPEGGGFVHLRSRVRATDAAGRQSDVLDWRLVGLVP